MTRLLFYCSLITMLFFGCKKDNAETTGTVELYQLKAFQLLPGKCQIDASVAVLQDMPTIKNQDIIAYSPTNYQFEFTASAMEKIKSFQDFTPFAITIDKQVVYYGFFKPATSSSSCDNSITMDIDWVAKNKVFLKLGYPGQSTADIDDQRNNPDLLEVLSNQNKLR